MEPCIPQLEAVVRGRVQEMGCHCKSHHIFQTGLPPTYLFQHPPNAKDSTLEFIQALERVSPSLGMILGKPKLFETLDTRNVNYITILDEIIAKNPVIVMVRLNK